jgi:RimJ/RimL family protein N-acetyltransferase
MNILVGEYIIRDWRRDDAAAIARHADNPKIARNLRDAFPSPYTPADAEEFLSRVLAKARPTAFAIATQSEAIGGIGLVPGHDVERMNAELGYWLAEDYWGRGIMTSLVTAFTARAFDEFSLNRIFATPYAYNAGSARVLQKAGFTLEGRLRASAVKDGAVVDQLLYAKLRPGLE